LTPGAQVPPQGGARHDRAGAWQAAARRRRAIGVIRVKSARCCEMENPRLAD
jgi:hypothetical protein